MKRNSGDGLKADLFSEQILFALEWDWRHGNEQALNNQNDIGPLAPNDKPLAMLESLGIVHMLVCSGMDRAVNQDEYRPWKEAAF